MKSKPAKPVITIKADAIGAKVSSKGKPSNFVNDWAAFRATLPVKKEV